jgi:hypothetical protein
MRLGRFSIRVDEDAIDTNVEDFIKIGSRKYRRLHRVRVIKGLLSGWSGFLLAHDSSPCTLLEVDGFLLTPPDESFYVLC